MRFDLIDYQRDAATHCLNRLQRGRGDWHTYASRSAFALSAITGAGKTVIATAVIEALLHGSAELDTQPDPQAAFLWVTDDPALNRQTRNKMLAASDLLQPARLTVLDNDFLDSTLSAGRVYFLNIQKLSRSAGLAQGGRNLRQYSMWEVLGNTIRGGNVDLYLVLDEAHRGMKATADRRTVVQRIISGQEPSNPPVPVVWGISATIERFSAAMEGVTDRTNYPPVEVDLEKVRASGLIKDEIVLDEPGERGTFSTTLLREAVRTTVDFEQRWATYSQTQGEPLVLPVLVVQVPDRASVAKLGELVEIIDSEWPDLGPGAIAHVLGEHERLHLGVRAVDWISPESIQTDHEVRVVLAKEAISTGWDCPRAEVLYSERPARDVTHIAQIIGRMVRQPLARRIATDDTLNTVACFLPLFDRTALSTIKSELEGHGRTDGELRVGATVVRAGRIFSRSASISPGVFVALGALPSLPAPDVLASPLRRAKELARLLTDDAAGSALLPEAGARLTKALMAKLDGLAAQHADTLGTTIADLKSAEIRRTRLSNAGIATSSSRFLETHLADLTRDTGRVINSVKEGVGRDYLAHCAGRRNPVEDLIDVRTRVAALFLIEDVRPELEAEATKWVRDRLTQFNVDILNTTGATRDAYRRVQEQTTSPEPVLLELRENHSAATRDGSGHRLPTYPGHIYADDDGRYPAALNDWERTVIATEAARNTFVAWYRNPARATPASLRIAYRRDTGDWTSMQVDFLVVSRRTDGSLGVSIIDPHGDYLADARPKLLALADYAERFGEAFVRVDAISQVAGKLRVLAMKEPAVREAIRSFTGTQVAALFESDLAGTYA